MKNSIIFYKDWLPLINGLPDDKQLKLYQLLFSFDKDNLPKIDDAHLKSVFDFISKKIIDNDNKYNKKCLQAKKSAETRWKNKKMRTHTNECERIQTNANVKNAMLNDTVTVTDTVNVTSETSLLNNNINTSTSEVPKEVLKNFNENEVLEVDEEKYIDCEELIKNICASDILEALSEEGRQKVISYCPGWQNKMLQLAGVFAKNICEGKLKYPAHLDNAFSEWCRKYTKGEPPK